MFYSTGNNFGAGVIGFREACEDGHIVLNAKFSCSPRSEAYWAAEVLEVYVPELGISRSMESGVTVRFRETDGYGSVHDGGTFSVPSRTARRWSDATIVRMPALWCTKHCLRRH